MQEKRKTEERAKEKAMRKLAEEAIEAQDRRQMQQKEASQSLEKEVREAQLRHMKEKGKTIEMIDGIKMAKDVSTFDLCQGRSSKINQSFCENDIGFIKNY